MQLRELARIEIRPRHRTIDANIVAQLKASISTKGLLHAPVVGTDKDTSAEFLLCGEHRLRAMMELHNAQEEFYFNGEVVPPGRIPIVNVRDLSPADLLEAELEENIIRASIPWQDRARALAAIHDLRQGENPAQSFKDTAQELAERSGRSAASGTLRSEVRNAVILTNNLDRPSVSGARSATEALTILYKEEEAKVGAELIRRKSLTTPPTIRIIRGDMHEVLPTLPSETFDLVIADPPYGIGVSGPSRHSQTVEHHNYDDSLDNARAIMQRILSEGFRVAKMRANLFIFGDIDLFPFFKEASKRMAWKPFRTPIIWGKGPEEIGPVEGLAPWGREGFRRTYELIFFATKGNKGLLQSPVDILLEKRVPRGERTYGAEKPVTLMRRLIESATMPGDNVLDPCCGIGSTLVACKQLKRKATGIEIDEAATNMATLALDEIPETAMVPADSAEPAETEVSPR